MKSVSEDIDKVLNDYDTIISGGSSVALQEKKQQIKKVVNDTAKTKAKDIILPKWYAWVCLILFVLANLSVGLLVGAAYFSDLALLAKNVEANRLITPEVIMSLVAGITVQTGTAFIIITKYFFEKGKELE